VLETERAISISLKPREEQTAESRFKMVLRTNLPEYPDTTVADFDFSVSIGKCESMPDISEALIESKYLAAG
jgi:hypothetical protein